MTSLEALRRALPVLDELVYLNAGAHGPVARDAARAAMAELEQQIQHGRDSSYRERRARLRDMQRGAYAALLGAADTDVALTTSTTDGIATVLAGLTLRPSDEVLTTDEEHAGVLGPVAQLRDRLGVRIRQVPFNDLPNAIRPKTRLIACSDVSWISGKRASLELSGRPDGVMLVLDGAQAAGAVPVDVRAFRCDAYAAAGHKWLCGPVGTGALYVSEEVRDEVAVARPSIHTLADEDAPLDSAPADGARRFDAPALAAEASAHALAALNLLGLTGFQAMFRGAAALAGQLAARLTESGYSVFPRHDTTLVSWRDPAAEVRATELARAGVLVRSLPGRSALRASVGAWNRPEDLEALLAALDGHGDGGRLAADARARQNDRT